MVSITLTWVALAVGVGLVDYHGRNDLAARSCRQVNQLRADAAAVVDAAVQEGYIEPGSELNQRAQALRRAPDCR